MHSQATIPTSQIVAHYLLRWFLFQYGVLHDILSNVYFGIGYHRSCSGPNTSVGIVADPSRLSSVRSGTHRLIFDTGHPV